MRSSCFVVLFLLCSAAAYAQPRWSPSIRSEREMKWLIDSVHVTRDQEQRISGLSLAYQEQMDKAADGPNKTKAQARLMKKKDADYKAILTKEQYKKYYNREQLIRKQEKVVYKGKHQPY